MKARVVGVAAALCFAAAVPAEAQWTNLLNQCSPGAIRTCASFQAQVTDIGGGRSRLQIRVRNLWGVVDEVQTGSILAQLGVMSPDLVNVVNDSPVATAVEGAEVQGTPGDNWGFQASTARLGEVTWALAAGDWVGPGGTTLSGSGNGGIFSCLPPNGTRTDYFRTCVDGEPGGWVEFALTADGPIDVGQLQLAWGVISMGDGDYSVQGSTCVAGNCGGEVVPEPITIVLVGTGLAGIGAARRRRKRDNAVVADA